LGTQFTQSDFRIPAGAEEMLRTILLTVVVTVGTPALAPAQGPAPIRVMILDGESAGSYHRWDLVTPVLEAQLAETGLFDVDVVTAPPAGGDYSAFSPDFTAYDVVVMNYDAPDERWPASLKSSFEDYVADGGGLVVVHGSDNAFPGWEAFNQMIGVGGWRGRNQDSGPLWYYQDGRLVSDDSPGRAGSHGRRIPFRMDRREAHPITAGLPDSWMHQGDELYATLRGPGTNMTVIATAFSDPANAGTGKDEPMLMVLAYEQGRIFHTALGHDISALSSVDFVVTFQRGTEWAATGAVTQAVPPDFPRGDTVAYRAGFAAMEPVYDAGLNPLDTARSREQ
jgi:hypothetical protein